MSRGQLVRGTAACSTAPSSRQQMQRSSFLAKQLLKTIGLSITTKFGPHLFPHVFTGRL